MTRWLRRRFAVGDAWLVNCGCFFIGVLAVYANLEQRFGRIHRIGQTEVCHLWNLVAEETREGDVYRTLLNKLEEARKALGGKVFDVLGKLQFEGKPLRELLMEAIRYGERPEVKSRLSCILDHAFDPAQLAELLEERALAHDAMDAGQVYRIREDMERAEARRLQPHYIESFFLEAFKGLGGTAKQREPRRYAVTHVPATIRNRDRLIGMGDPVQPRYERIVFEKQLDASQGQSPAAFVCPGHPLLDSVIDLTLERHDDLLRRGALLVDATDPGTTPRVLVHVVPPGPDPGHDRPPISRAVPSQGHPASAARARAVVMDIERGLGFEPTDRELEKLGYDIESRVPGTGRLRFIEVKGRISGAETITVTKNEVLYSLNKPEDYILAVVEFLDEATHRVHYIRRPFQREPDFGVTSVNYNFSEILERAEEPR